MADTMVSYGYDVDVCYTTGCPSLGSSSISDWLSSRLKICRYVNGYDIVPSLLPVFKKRYAHTGTPVVIHEGRVVEGIPWYRFNLLMTLVRGVKDHRLCAYITNMAKIVSFLRNGG